MDNKDIIVAIHTKDKKENSGYNVLDTFSQGLIKGFNNIGVKAYTLDECYDNNIGFNIAIGFNNTGLDAWQKVLSSNVTNIMWSTDSVFAQNFDIIKQFSAFDKFIVFESTPADTQPIGKYLPSLKHGYIPVATDLDLWKKTNCEKEIDIVYFSQMTDYEEKIENLKATMPELVFKLMVQLLEITVANPNLTFYQMSEIISSTYGLNLDLEQYLLLFKNVSEIAMYEQKVKMIQSLSDFNVVIYGEGPWEKYIKGNIKYAGKCKISESVDIINKSKIVLYCHPMQLGLGLHESILNASAAGTFSLVSDNPSFKAEFNDSLGYFNHSTFDDIAQKASYYLSNDEERSNMAEKAHQIIKEKHTWSHRAKSITDIID